MKKAALGIIALAMSFMSTAVFAYGDNGDIRSIDPCDSLGTVLENGTMAKPYVAGETAYFRIRLENVNSEQTWTSKNANPWVFEYSIMPSLTGSQWLMNPPKVGVYVSGQLRGATVVSCAPAADAPWYTDIVCAYTVRPGDLALPMTLANSAGAEMGNGMALNYYLDTIPKSAAWKLVAHVRKSAEEWDTVTSTVSATFKYGTSDFFGKTAVTEAEMLTWTTDYSLKQAGLYIKSVDFAADEYTVAKGRTERVAVGIIGGANTNGNGTVYAMVKDGGKVSLAEEGTEVVTISSTPAREMDGVYQVAKVIIPSGEDVTSFSFKVKGEADSGSEVVYLSTTKEFAYGESYDLVTNFVTAVVNCTPPPPPYISVTLDGSASKSVTSSSGYTDYATKLTVTLSEAYTSDFSVEVTPSMLSGSGTDPFSKYIGMSTYSENGFTEKTTTVSFTKDEMDAGVLSKDLYIYVLGADNDTDGIGNGIKFTPKATGAGSYFDNESISAILYIKKSTPQIVYPVENHAYTGLAGGVNSTFSFKVSDDYSNMKGTFIVEWLKTGSGSPLLFEEEANSDGEISVPVRYNAGEYTTRFRVKNSSGVYSEYRTVTVQVNPAKQVSAVVEDPDDSGEYSEMAGEISVRFKLTEAFEDSTLYAFLVPLDAASSNLVVCKAFETGVAIKSGDTESTGTAKIRLLDGSDDTLPLSYSIALRTAKTLSSGETIGIYESKDLELFIHNVAPVVTAVGMSGSAPVMKSGATFTGKASMGLNKIFTLEAEDVEADLTNIVKSVWMFSDPKGNASTHTVLAPIADTVVTNVFEMSGTYTCTVRLQDKDMTKPGEMFSFNVEVLDTPAVDIVFPNSDVYKETDADKGQSYFNVTLSATASKPLVVGLECTRIGADGILNISTNLVHFRVGQDSQQVNIDELDGTASSVSMKGGFSVTARVLTEEINEDGTPYKDVYLPCTRKIYVANEAPTIVLPVDTGVTNDAAINVYMPIKWRIDDVDFDRTNNLTVTWTTSEGRSQEFKGNDVFEGVYTNIFTAGGAKTVTITVTDKDDMMSSVTLYYKVSPSKTVKVYPMGPYYGGLTALSRRYATAAGIGEGRVWGNGGTPLVESFVHNYTYGFSASSAEIHAWGYKNGQSDDGSIVSGKDIAIDSVGNSFKLGDDITAAQFYTYTDTAKRDSFFYAWIIASTEEEGTAYVGTPLISPVSPKSKSGDVQYSLSLPMEQSGDDANPVFPDRYLEAFFAKELYPCDNMGDMNADGIPDYFATLYWSKSTGESMTVPEAMTGQAIAGSNGGSEESEGNSATASDLANIASYNDDLDFLPVAWTSDNPLNPSVRNWGPGEPFTTIKEIRGFGIGLNEPGVSDYELTDAERAALYAACALAGAPAADYTAATNWAKSNGWTPESISSLSGTRLNPLNADTDGDGFDDGWEYFFWYYAKVGAVTNGVWGRLEGRRFDFTAPGMSVRIAPEEIAAAFNPHTARATEVAFGIDFDNDGLSDLEEFALGTNPCDWDSDGDGVADLWEVINGLNPVSPDGSLNPDCDFMARCDYADDTFTLYTFADGRVFALPTATASAVVPVSPASTSSYFKVEIAAGDAPAVYWTVEKPITYTIDGIEYLAKGEDSFASYEIGGVAYLGAATVLASGTPVVSVATDAQEVPAAMLPETGFEWTDPKTLDRISTKKALEVFNYGGDGVTYVPCSTNVTSYVDIPVEVAVVSAVENKTITLIHDQVKGQYGFDPRVAWNINEYGFLDDRWRAQDSESAGSAGVAGMPTNTLAYTSRDEFLLMQYRAKAKSEYKAIASVAGLSVDSCIANTTFPNLPLEFVRTLEYSNEPFSATNATYKAYWDSLSKNITIHGADTDFDGVPDGWELYVATNPNLRDDAMRYADEDRLSLAQEYAGVDSCNAYTNRFDAAGNEIYPEVESITKNNPGVKEGWWNKFFPTNPDSSDTDGDGLMDHEERDSYSGTFYVGRNSYRASFSFIYGDNAQKYAADAKSTCFLGGGLNPCTVDTDGDLLPDAWEWEFAGIVFSQGKPSVALEATDLHTLTVADGLKGAASVGTNATDCILGGMDGTLKADANWDFDHDGLINFQEYLVQTLRHLRYDDSLTPIMGVDPTSRKFIKFMPFCAWDGSAFHEKCKENGFTGLGAWQFSKLGYFTLPPNSWDPVAQNTAGLTACVNYEHSEGAGYRIMLRPSIDIPLIGTVTASGYMTTDPRRWDSDDDGMDDYYEIFHGLNPILGSAANPLDTSEQGMRNYLIYDVIASKYSGVISSWSNAWTDYNVDEQPSFDAVKHPWMIGTMECDADGDGLRNDEESLKVDLADPINTHTDPTPLWMTDSSSAKFASFTSQYYAPDPYLSSTPGYNELTSAPDIFSYSMWRDLSKSTIVVAPGSGGINRDWMFSFEENEGFDTDHDFKRDTTELVSKVEPTSDPLDFTDPVRRQALYLPGFESAAVSYDSESRRSVGTEPDLLKQFTVECWVRPDDNMKDVVIVERVCVYGGSTLQNGAQSIRANFRIGLDSAGKVYGEYEGSTVDSGSVRVTARELEAGVWTHIAFRYDGNTAALHLNGDVAPSASVSGVGLIPANGIDGILQETGNSVIPYTGYRALPCANIIGARALTPNAVSVNEETTWSDFSSYFKGWVDEIRVWDGARTPSEIHADYLKRYTQADISSFRETVFKAWRNGATRANSASGISLPPELLLHYNFSTLPGGVEPHNVITAPAGFKSAVLDNVRKPNGDSLNHFLDIGWWSTLAVNSTVYFDYSYVPWIPNSVAHLPLMDGSSADSRYWSSYAAGVIGNTEGYRYPNTANPYSSYVYRYEKVHALNRIIEAPTLSQMYDSNGIEVYFKYAFQLRSDFVGTTDLVPLGGAFAKRGSDFWDGSGAMDAWTLTKPDYNPVDANDNGIPDWAEALGYTTQEAYLRALAEGLLPSTGVEVKDPLFKDIADANHDGLYDWWQRRYDLKSEAQDDSDKDGLADFAEYLVSEVFKFGTISPVLSRSNGKELDYFRKAGRLYLGELFSDHDFMEDEWENKFADAFVDSAHYDPSADNDADGWSNYAECRARTLPDRYATITAEGQQLPDYPEPTITVNVNYKNASMASAQIVVRAFGKDDLGSPDAVWVVPGSDETLATERVIGVNPGVKSKYTLGPGTVVPGTVFVSTLDPSELTMVDGNGVWGNASTAVWRSTLKESPIEGEVNVANISAVLEHVGKIDYSTGEIEIDFPLISKYRYELGDGTHTFYTPMTNNYIRSNMSQSYFKIEWQSKRFVGESMWRFSLSRATTGHVHEGLNTFEVFVDLNGDGAYNVGEPLGVVKNVDVGWNGAEVSVELKNSHPVAGRFDLALSGDSASLTRSTSISVDRLSVNGQSTTSYGSIKNAHVMDREIGNRGYLHEGDFILPGAFDIDWSNFTADVLNSPMVSNGKMNVTQVVYRVTLSSSEVLASNTVDVVRFFTASHLVPTPLDVNQVNYGARPVFTWKFDDPGADTYTAFSVRIKDSCGVEIWNSGFQEMPPKNTLGNYTWKAPLSVNDLASAGKVFSNTNSYTWEISAHNAKYQTANWSAPREFRMNAYASDEANNTGRYCFDACVKYFGPGAYSADISSMKGIIRVEAYLTPDFKGVPAARMFVSDDVSVTNGSHEANVTFQGLESGTYYVLAFVDSDGDGKRSEWESWGYACPRGDIASSFTFAPTPIEVGFGLSPKEILYIEDTDVDQDALPDVYEYDSSATKDDGFLRELGVPENDHNGYITVNPNLQAAIDNLISAGQNIGLLSHGPSRVSMQLASLAVGVPTLANTIERSTLAIKSIALEGGNVKLTVGASADEPSAGTVFVYGNTLTATIVVRHADKIDGNWQEIEFTKTFEIEDGKVSDVLEISLEELKARNPELDTSKGFFKINLK